MVEQAILDAVTKALEESKARGRKFSQSVDLAINLRNVDLSIPKNRIEEEVNLPHGRGGDIKVGVFASADLAARSKGICDPIVTPEQIADMADDKKAFKKLVGDVAFFLAEAPLMPTIGKSLGVVLGPRGKMPRPIPPQADPAPIVENLKKTIKVRSRDKPTFHALVGDEGMSAAQLAENVDSIIKRVETRLEHGRMQIRSAFVKTSMGPAVQVI